MITFSKSVIINAVLDITIFYAIAKTIIKIIIFLELKKSLSLKDGEFYEIIFNQEYYFNNSRNDLWVSTLNKLDIRLYANMDKYNYINIRLVDENDKVILKKEITDYMYFYNIYEDASDKVKRII